MMNLVAAPCGNASCDHKGTSNDREVFHRFQGGRMKRIPRILAVLGVAAIAAAAFAFLRAAPPAHAAPRVVGGQCVFLILPGHSDTQSYTCADGDMVTVHSQLYEYRDNLTGDYCGELESITTISDNGRGAPVYGFGGNELVYHLPNGGYGAEGGGYVGYSNALYPPSVAETTDCAAPGGSFGPKDGEPAINTGAANYCPLQ
jgi:hypothetical protein